MDDLSDDYPIILIPEEINSEFRRDNYYPCLPKKPEFQKSMPKYNSEQTFLYGFSVIGIILFGAMLFLGAIPSLINDEGNMAEAVTPLSVIFIVCILIFRNEANKKKEYDKQFNFEMRLYVDGMENYRKDQKKYEEEISFYHKKKKEIERLSAKEFVDFCLLDYYKNSTTMPSYCDIQYKKGRTEERLYCNLFNFRKL